MILKRIPLFIIGLLYGAVINGAALGIGYGLYAAGATAALILEAMCGNGGCAVAGGEGILFFFAILGAILLAAAAIGFVGGVIYGVIMGAWHCAMDFYNQGFCRGLSSPFRFLHAKIMESFYHDNTALEKYYQSVDIHFLFNRDKKSITPYVKELIVEKVVKPVFIFKNAICQKTKNENFEKGILHSIAQFLVDEECKIKIPTISAVANRIAFSATGKQQNNVIKISDFFSRAELLSLLAKHSFLNSGNDSWNSDQRKKEKSQPASRNTISLVLGSPK